MVQVKVVVEAVLSIKAESLQDFCDKLVEVLEKFVVAEVAISSPRINEPNVSEIICINVVRRASSVPLLEEVWDITPTDSQGLSLSVKTEKAIPTDNLLALALRVKVREVFSLKRAKLRRLVIVDSASSKDVNSFLHRVVRDVREKFLYAEEISAFLHEAIHEHLVLAASTTWLGPPPNPDPHAPRILKRNILYRLSEQGNVVAAYKKNREIIESNLTGFTPDEYEPQLKSGVPYSRGCWPLSLAASEIEDRETKASKPLGVLRITNIMRRGPTGKWPSEMTWYDNHFASFLCEIIYVLVQKYIQFMDSETDYARLTHGIGANIDAAAKFAGNVKGLLYGDGDLADYRYVSVKGDVAEERSLYHTVVDLNHFLDDVQFQFQKASGEIEAISISRIDNLHADVLMPAIRLIDGITTANNKRKPPTVSNIADRGAKQLKPIEGNREGLISVFRNLFENSIKYTPGDCKIDFEFSDTPASVVIDYFDNGIGIDAEDLERVFVEGFRSRAARRLSNRGIGVGLSYSKDVLQLMDGDIECLPRSKGVHFRLRLKKSK